MFANNAIKSLSKTLKEGRSTSQPKWDESTYHTIEIIIDRLKNAEKYHLGNNNMLGMVENQFLKFKPDQGPFIGETAIDVNLPYDECWFDFIDPYFMKMLHPNGPTLKAGILASDCNHVNDPNFPRNILQLITCYQFGPSGIWGISPEISFIKVGSNFTYDELEYITYRNNFV